MRDIAIYEPQRMVSFSSKHLGGKATGRTRQRSCATGGCLERNLVRQSGRGAGSPAAGAEEVNATRSERMPSTLPKGASFGSRKIPRGFFASLSPTPPLDGPQPPSNEVHDSPPRSVTSRLRISLEGRYMAAGS